MKKRSTSRPAPDEVSDLRPEYDFSDGVRRKHAARYAAGNNVVVLDPDVARVFKDSASVNEVLRSLLPVIRRLKRSTPRRKSPSS